MSEYMEKHAVAKLIGAPPGEEGGLVVGGWWCAFSVRAFFMCVRCCLHPGTAAVAACLSPSSPQNHKNNKNSSSPKKSKKATSATTRAGS